MVELCKKNDTEYYIRCTDSSLDTYLDFTRILGEVEHKYFDYQYKLWVCDAVSAQKIQDELNNQGIGKSLKYAPYNYQRQAIAYCLNHNGALLQLPCGAGKTLIGLGIFSELVHSQELKPPGIFVVKASLKAQWLKEVSKFTDFRACIINTYKAATAKIQNKIRRKEKSIEKLQKNFTFNKQDELLSLDRDIKQLQNEANTIFQNGFDISRFDIFIVNYEAMADEKVRQTLHSIKPNFWYVDEVDCIKDPATKRSQNLREFVYSKYRYGATAAPIRKNPKDLYGIFSFILPSLFPSEKQFDDRYLRFYRGRISGSKNEAELAEIIKPHKFMRSFEQIADQLPQQTVIQLYCDLTPKQIQMTKRLLEEKEKTSDAMDVLARKLPPNLLESNAEYQRLKGLVNAFQTFAQELADDERLLQMSESSMAHQYITGSPSSKLELCMEVIQKIVDSGEKVCIFSRYIPMQKIIAERLEQMKARKEYDFLEYSQIYGAISDQKRAEILERYNNTPEQRVLLLSDAGEAGLNLSTTKYMIEFELADSAAKQTQRHGRIQRADSIHKNVIVYQLIANESYDEIAKLIVDKKEQYRKSILT